MEYGGGRGRPKSRKSKLENTYKYSQKSFEATIGQ
jgi:hypothetical protein